MEEEEEEEGGVGIISYSDTKMVEVESCSDKWILHTIALVIFRRVLGNFPLCTRYLPNFPMCTCGKKFKLFQLSAQYV